MTQKIPKCVVCGAPRVKRGKTGRPPLYCESMDCKQFGSLKKKLERAGKKIAL